MSEENNAPPVADSAQNDSGLQGSTHQKEGNALKESEAPKESHKRKESVKDWTAIEVAITTAQMTYPEAAAAFNVPENTIRKRASRKRWAIGPRSLKKIVQSKVTEELAHGANAISASEIEKHKRTVFELAQKSLAMMKPRAPKTFREADSADKMGRRAAGLQDDQTNVGVLLQLNEAINAHDAAADAEPVESLPVLDAEIVPE